MAKLANIPTVGQEGRCLVCGHSDPSQVKTEHVELLGTIVACFLHPWCKRETMDKHRGILPDDLFPPEARAALRPVVKEPPKPAFVKN